MAVAPTGQIFKSLVFDGESSRNYGVYITGQAVYNAPERDVEMISIPNRNGTFALDKGRFENVEVTYPAGIFADTETDFANAVSDFRNFLCSRKGYVRLTDDYNQDEYRMAVYKSGLEVTPVNKKAGEFEITFDCKPQRYLKNGDASIGVSSGQSLFNPTLFDANPMLEVTGYGEISLNGEVMAVNNEPLGQTKLSKAGNANKITLDVSNLNTGDSIYKLEADKPQLEYGLSPKNGSFGSVEITSVSNCTAYLNGTLTKQKLIIVPDFPQIVKGTNVTVSASAFLTLTLNGTTYNGSVTVALQYSGSANTIGMTIARSGMPTTTDVYYDPYYKHPAYYGDSTKLIAPTPMYLDLDIGEAYGVVNGEVVSFNNIVSLPAELPKLKAGNNTITFDNTVTDLKVVPRWWKI